MSNTIVEKEEYKGCLIEYHWDECPESPREWDNLGTIISWHRNYKFEEETNLSPQEWFNRDQIDTDDEGNEIEIVYNEELDEKFVCLPLFLYDHSGLRISTGSFSCPWDSGQVGFIYATKENVKKEYGDLSEETKKKVIERLECEVKIFDQYLSGDVYEYIIKDGQTREILESCSGFYGIDSCQEEARSWIDWYIKDLELNRLELFNVI